MEFKKIILPLSFAVLISLLGLVLGFILAPENTGSLLLRVSSRAASPYFRPNIEPKGSAWKTHTDNEHGFSFRYPGERISFASVEYLKPEGSGLSVSTFPLINCLSAEEYVRSEITPHFTELDIRPISVDGSEGFLIENKHLDYMTPGPEAYIINCPYMIRLGFNPTGIQDGEKVFERILASVKTWQPPE